MKLGTFRSARKTFIGAWHDAGVIDLPVAYAAYLRERKDCPPGALTARMLPNKMRAFLEGGDQVMQCAAMALEFVANRGFEALQALDGEPLVYQARDVKILAPILDPAKVICIGLNYADHVQESGADLPNEPVFFSKFATSIIGPGEAVVVPQVSEQVDYEAELAFLIGRRAKHVSVKDTYDYIAGYTIMNDVSARDLQLRDGQWIKGKALDTFAPLGPFIVTPDEVPDPHNLSIRLKLNGRVMQNSSTKNLIFKIPEIIAFLSDLFTLEPGDVIATGTPPGVGFVRKPPVFMRPGDKVEIEVERVGMLVNRVEAAVA